MQPVGSTSEYVHDCSSTSPTYDSDSYEVGIDTLSTYCMTNDIRDIQSNASRVRCMVKGINGLAPVKCKGTGCIKVLDDKGQLHNFIIHELYYCPTLPFRVISPQHLDKMWRRNGIGSLQEVTNSEKTQLIWKDKHDKQYTLTIKHNTVKGVPIFQSAPGVHNFINFMSTNTKILHDDQQLLCCISTTSEVEQIVVPSNEQGNGTLHGEARKDENDSESIKVDFGDEQVTENDEDEFKQMDPKSELLLWHYKMGHMPFSTLRSMANNGIIPRRLLHCKVPVCADCMYGQLTR
jgi:GAG-pre-integrase domain